MYITRVKIDNFRSIRSIEIPLSETTVFIGPNNSGKTSILEALRIALTRRWGQRGTGFTEYDIHLADAQNDPKAAGPVCIEIELKESRVGEWHEDLKADLNDIQQINRSGLSSIFLKVSCGWDEPSSTYMPKWEFLNVDKKPLTGGGLRAANLQEFFQYLPIFYLDALRDAESEYSARSQFWGKMLREMQIPEKLQKRASQVFDRLNARLLAADPKLGKLVSNLGGLNKVVSGEGPSEVGVRATPLHPWDLLARSEVICRAGDDRPWFPLIRHGQGMQSLSVMFLFKAFVEQVLVDLYKPNSSAVLALEEPETHLHPQATRALWSQIFSLPGQKLISTHSPYFLQHVPFRDLRLVRATQTGTEVRWLPSTYRASIPSNAGLLAVIAEESKAIRYDADTKELVSLGKLSQQVYRKLLPCFADNAEATASLSDLKKRSISYISEEELHELETYARRIRGEIFFARKWLLVEGQGEYLIVHAMARALDFDLDENGISVIDCQNNGNPAIFAVLARALAFPWHSVFDGDVEGLKFTRLIGERDFSPEEVQVRCANLTGNLEQQLVADGLQTELREVLRKNGVANVEQLIDVQIAKELASRKIQYARDLVLMLQATPDIATRMLAPFRQAIEKLKQSE